LVFIIHTDRAVSNDRSRLPCKSNYETGVENFFTGLLHMKQKFLPTVEMGMAAPEFIKEQLAIIRRAFFAKLSEKRFFQERNLLLQAISFPAAHLKERYGVDTPLSLSRTILATVIDTIRTKGNCRGIERVSVYFLHCVQEHLKHHGEEYYNQAKAARTAEDFLPAVMRNVQVGVDPVTTRSLPELHRILKSRGGRKKQRAEAQLDLI
jgi:hypothetical protein